MDPARMVEIHFINMPVDLFSHLRRHFNELGRELRLLSLTAPEQYPLALEFARLYLQIEHERRHVTGLQPLDEAIEAGLESVDLTYLAPPTAPNSMSHLANLLDEIYSTFGEESLLAVQPSPVLQSLQNWYLGEFERQSHGHAPIPWNGPMSYTARQEVS